MYQVLTQLPFTTNEMELDYYHHKMSVQVALRAAKQLMTRVLGISLKKSLKC